MGMRIKLTTRERTTLFGAVEVVSKNWHDHAQHLKISPRTLYDWRRDTITIPYHSFQSLCRLGKISEKNFTPKILPDFWNTRKAGKKGSITSMQLYGNPGTKNGRRKGGLASLQTHKKMGTAFKLLMPVHKPKHSHKLAEFLGIMFGDGHLSQYQLSVTTNSETDRQHAYFVQELIATLFKLPSKVTKKPNQNALEIVASSKNLVTFIHELGMPIGNKLRAGLTIPYWVQSSKIFSRSFIRGLFDTDGCIYRDSHTINGKRYDHMGWTITSYSQSLVHDILSLLKGWNYFPTFKSPQKSVFIRRQAEIHRYFKEIGTSNKKHIGRYNQFSKHYHGEVA